MNIMHQNIISTSLFLVKILVYLLPNPGRLGTRQEYTMDGTLMHHWAPCTRTHYGILTGGGKNKEETHADTEKTFENSIQTVTQAQDWTYDPGAVIVATLPSFWQSCLVSNI